MAQEQLCPSHGVRDSPSATKPPVPAPGLRAEPRRPLPQMAIPTLDTDAELCSPPSPSSISTRRNMKFRPLLHLLKQKLQNAAQQPPWYQAFQGILRTTQVYESLLQHCGISPGSKPACACPQTSLPLISILYPQHQQSLVLSQLLTTHYLSVTYTPAMWPQAIYRSNCLPTT